MTRTRFISAICTPLTSEGELHVDGLRTHLNRQWTAGIAGVLVGGTMGLMQLLSDRAYRQLVEYAAAETRGSGELLVGVGDTSLARTRDRIEAVQDLPIDGVVVLTPWFWKFSQAELVDYFRALADFSRKPLFLYDLPGLTGTKLEFETVLQVASHPNVRGIKCSVPLDWTRRLMDRVPEGVRVIPAQPHLIDVLIRQGIAENLDGIFAIAPRWTVGIAEAAERQEWEEAARLQRRLSEFLDLILSRYPLWGACSAILNAAGVDGRAAPAPIAELDAVQREQLLWEPLVRELLATGV